MTNKVSFTQLPFQWIEIHAQFNKQELKLIKDLLARERHRLCVDAQMYEQGWNYPHYQKAYKKRQLIIQMLERMESEKK